MRKFDFKVSNSPEEAFKQLFQIIGILRDPDGCPWDRKQNNKTIAESLLDETYEYIDAIDKHDIENEREEIGDVLINVLMELKIHLDQGDFLPEEAIDEVSRKLIRRHPHVFGDKSAKTAEEGLKMWNEIKQEKEGKKRDEKDFFSHIPSSLPPLEEAYEIQKNMAKIAFDFQSPESALEKAKEELKETEEAIEKGDKDETEEEIGDLLFSVVNLARLLKIRPNTALFRSNCKIKERFQKTIDIAIERNIPRDRDHNKELNEIWDEIKRPH